MNKNFLFLLILLSTGFCYAADVEPCRVEIKKSEDIAGIKRTLVGMSVEEEGVTISHRFFVNKSITEDKKIKEFLQYVADNYSISGSVDSSIRAYLNGVDNAITWLIT